MIVKELKAILNSLATDDTELCFGDQELYLFGVGSVDSDGTITRESDAKVTLASPKDVAEQTLEIFKKNTR